MSFRRAACLSLALLMLVGAAAIAAAGGAREAGAQTGPAWLDPSLTPEQRADACWRVMSLEEKVGQMTQINATRCRATRTTTGTAGS